MTQFDVELIDVIKEFPGRGSEQAVRAVDQVSLQINPGEFFALLGPSGCGKTTTLRMIAGFEATSSGQILIRGNAVQHVPPFHRPVNTVFQDYALFPHMTALQNVMFGLEMENLPKAEVRARAVQALDLVQLPQAANRKPRELSGGQQQRVALARALVKNPMVLLLDEPLGALDLKLRKAMQYELKAMQQRLGITFIYVTHDQEEAMTMADRIAVMSRGKVLQIGTPEEIYESPSERFVADFIGETNFVSGILLTKEDGYGTVRIGGDTQVKGVLPKGLVALDSEVSLAIRPEKIGLYPQGAGATTNLGDAVPPAVLKANLDQRQSSDSASLDALGLGLDLLEQTTILSGEIEQVYYIGTDTRYQVKLNDTVTIVARVQNFGHRFDTIYKKGEKVFIYWEVENARILTH